MTRILVVINKMMMMIILQGHCTRKQPDKSILYNTYYQWVSIFLMAQVFMFIFVITNNDNSKAIIILIIWITRRYPYFSCSPRASLISHMKAFLFYLPRMIWLSMEGGLMAFLCDGCSGNSSTSTSASASSSSLESSPR